MNNIDFDEEIDLGDICNKSLTKNQKKRLRKKNKKINMDVNIQPSTPISVMVPTNMDKKKLFREKLNQKKNERLGIFNSAPVPIVTIPEGEHTELMKKDNMTQKEIESILEITNPDILRDIQSIKDDINSNSDDAKLKLALLLQKIQLEEIKR
jgi:hypothetical protein